jgi:hypothetical protein
MGSVPVLVSAAVQAQPFPTKVVKIAPGGATDVVTRAVAQRLSPMWGQPVIIENKPGANTNDQVVKRWNEFGFEGRPPEVTVFEDDKLKSVSDTD